MKRLITDLKFARTGAVETSVAQTFAAWTASAPPSTPTQVSTDTAQPTATSEPTETIPPPSDTPADPLPAGAECIPTNTERTEAQVTRVIDGDTIEVDIAGQSFRLRYIGMDTPEDTSEVEYCGPEATSFNTLLVDGKTVTLVKDVSETDRFDRLLRYVIVDGFFVNYELVRQGFATGVTFPPDVACQDVFREAEVLARQDGIGCWGATPTPLPSDTPGPQPTATSVTVAQPPPNCHPSYPDVCLDPNAVDYDCAGGSGNGPLYV
jgi:micrococcal nuclease